MQFCTRQRSLRTQKQQTTLDTLCMIKAMWVRISLTLALSAAFAAVAAGAGRPQNQASILERFLARQDSTRLEYRALRHLEAHNEKFKSKASMEAWTELDRTGFRYRIVSETGSGYIRHHVLRAALAGEQKLWASGDPEKAALTSDNYSFEDRGLTGESLAMLAVVPRRADVLLVHGSAYVSSGDADLVRIEGRLSKMPSFWTRRVEIVRRYQRINGVRVPVEIESVASVLIAGKSTFRMTYEYETINGEHVGNPQPRAPVLTLVH